MDHIQRNRRSLEKGLDPYLVLSDEEIKRITAYNQRNTGKRKKPFKTISNCKEVREIWNCGAEENFQEMFSDEKVKIEEARWVRKVNEREQKKKEKERKARTTKS